MKGLILAVFAAVALSLVPHGAGAQSIVRPAFSLSRLNIGAGANYGWYNAVEQNGPNFPFRHEWQVGLFGAYNLLAPPGNDKGTTVSLVGASLYGLDNKVFHSYAGIRVGLFDGSRQ
jgi:hypothetical protein